MYEHFRSFADKITSEILCLNKYIAPELKCIGAVQVHSSCGYVTIMKINSCQISSANKSKIGLH